MAAGPKKQRENALRRRAHSRVWEDGLSIGKSALDAHSNSWPGTGPGDRITPFADGCLKRRRRFERSTVPRRQ